jgi:tetratricopeptide (TPR) repeat protein
VPPGSYLVPEEDEMSWRIRPRSAAVVVGTALALVLIGGVIGARSSTSDSRRQTAGTEAATRPADRLAATISRAQDRLRAVPGDYPTWAALGTAYLEQARITADPSYYPKAEGALRRSLEVRPDGNDQALTGLGALANARHDFAGAKDLAQRALRINAYSADAYAVLTDAETQLGNPSTATDAVQHLLDLRPGLAAFTRASYDLELHGRTADAQDLMRQALDAAVDRADIAFCRYQLGELAAQAGNLDEAESQYAAGIAADPDYLPLLLGRARLAAARGQLDAALTGYVDVTRRTPTPAAFLEHAELLRFAGRETEATQQLALATAAQQLFTANGGTDDLTGAALALADHRPADALRMARQEWQRRQFLDVADTLAWALHANGNDAEALTYAQRTGALGTRNAKYAYHQAMIELALGDRAAARRDLTRALDINRYFSPLDAPVAARTLAELGSS